jgi:hypothetical protein
VFERSFTMIQRFIKIGEGYSELFELIEIAKTNNSRVEALIALETTKNNKKVSSAVVVLRPVEPSNFQPLYISLEGIPIDSSSPSKRWQLFEALASELNKEIFRLEVKPSNTFQEEGLYYQYIIGVLRMNRMIKSL